jgi:hypothetical protein
VVRAFLHNLVDSALVAASDKLAAAYADLTGQPTDNAALAAVLAGKASKQDIADLIGGAPAALDTLAELAAQLLADEQGTAAILATIQQHTQQLAQKLAPTDLRQVVTLDQARQLAGSNGLLAGATYVVLGVWNGVSGGVLMTALASSRFANKGYIDGGIGGVSRVMVNLAAGTFQHESEYIKGIAGTAGIDYANPVTVGGAATLQVNKAYTVTGSGYQLTLPDPTQNIGAVVFVLIDKAATGLYPLSGLDYTLYARESLLLRASANGWTKTGGELLPMSARLETSLSQQDSLPGNTYAIVPLSVVAFNNSGLPALVNAAGNALVVQRAGRVSLNATIGLQDTVANGQYFCVITRGPGTPNGGATVLAAGYATTASNNWAFANLSTTLAVAAGDELKLCVYAGQPARLLGQYQSNVCSLTLTEL